MEEAFDMFFFLSKLIPLFLYPLGLACVLLVVAIATFWKRPRVAATVMSLALTVLLLGGNLWVAEGLIHALESQSPPLAELPQADAIVVLGGGILPPYPPRPWIEMNEGGDRVLYGAKLYHEGNVPWVILSGGRVEWKGGHTPESADMAELMEAMGVPATAILQDSTSLNTYENAVNIKQILQDKQLRGPILLVTSAAHMPRSLAIFKKQGMDAIAAPTDFRVTETDIHKGVLGFVLKILPQVDALRDTTIALKEHLGWVIYRLRGWL